MMRHQRGQLTHRVDILAGDVADHRGGQPVDLVRRPRCACAWSPGSIKTMRRDHSTEWGKEGGHRPIVILCELKPRTMRAVLGSI